jgi:hypothetical protein
VARFDRVGVKAVTTEFIRIFESQGLVFFLGVSTFMLLSALQTNICQD